MKDTNPQLHWIERFFSEFKETVKFVAGLVMVITFFIAADSYINEKIDKKISDETYINNLAKVLRPYAIFDDKGVIQYDHGAEKYIQEINIYADKRGNLKSVIITTKKYISNPPILIYIGYESYAYRSKRIETYKWKFDFARVDYISAEAKNEEISPLFIVEITN